MEAAKSGKYLVARGPEVDGKHWCDLVGCERACLCGATCEDHMEDRTSCPTFVEDEDEQAVTEVRKRIA